MQIDVTYSIHLENSVAEDSELPEVLNKKQATVTNLLRCVDLLTLCGSGHPSLHDREAKYDYEVLRSRQIAEPLNARLI